MLIKMLLSAPAAAFISYIITSFQLISFSNLEQLSLEFVLLGRIPGTEVYLQFEHLFVFITIFTWVPIAIRISRQVRKLIDERINRIGEQLELISL